MTILIAVASGFVLLALLLLYTPLMPRSYVGRSWFIKKLRELGVTYPIPEACVQEVVAGSLSAARMIAKSPFAQSGFNETYMRSLDKNAKFFQIWTRKGPEFERFDGGAWDDLVALATRYNIPRGNEP